MLVAVAVQPGAAPREPRSSPSRRRARPIPARLRSYRWARNVEQERSLPPGDRSPWSSRSSSPKPSTQQTLHRGAGLRHLCHVADGAHGMAGPAVPGPDGLRRPGRPVRGSPGGGWCAVLVGHRGHHAGLCACWRTILGLGSLRVRGLYLAVVTFVFALAAQQYFFGLPVLSGAVARTGPTCRSSRGSSSPCPSRASAPTTTWCSSSSAVVLLVVSRFRDSGVGRSIMAVRDNENAAAAYTGAAGLGEDPCLLHRRGPGRYGWRAAQPAPTPTSRSRDRELLPGGRFAQPGGHGGHRRDGLGHRCGHRRGLGHRHPRSGPEQRGARASLVEHRALGCPPLLPPGAQQIELRRPRRLLGLGRRRFGKEIAPTAATAPAEAAPTGRPKTARPACRTLSVCGSAGRLRWQLGRGRGHVAASRAGEIVGLIGSNGAGKSTLMNAIGGFVPATGSVRLGDEEIGDKPPAYRAAVGTGSDLPVGDAVPRADGDRDPAGRARGQGTDGPALDRARPAPGEPPEPARSGRGRPTWSNCWGSASYRDHYIARPVDRHPTGGGACRASCARRQGAVPR